MLDSSFSRIFSHLIPKQEAGAAKKTYLPDWFIILAVLFVVDWILGIMGAGGPITKWIFLVFNIPFGAIFVWMESSYVGEHSYMLGLRIGEIGGGAIFLFVVIAQSLVYLAVYEWLKKRHLRRGEA